MRCRPERCRLDAAGVARGAHQPRSGHRRAAAQPGDARGRARRCLAAHPATAELAKLLQTIFGIGSVAAITLIADLPELGRLSAKQVAALVGLAPHTKRSGKNRFRETAGHGRPGVRRVLFNAARAVALQRLLRPACHRQPTPEKVALIAVMRKILITANAVVGDRQP